MSLSMAGDYYMDYSDENIIYVNPKYQKLFEYLKANSDVVKLIAIYNLVMSYSEQHILWRNQDTFVYNKMILPIVEFYFIQNKMDLDYDFLKRVKWSIKDSSIKLSEEERALLKTALVWTVDYCNNTKYPAEDLLQWYIGLHKCIDECKQVAEV